MNVQICFIIKIEYTDILHSSYFLSWVYYAIHMIATTNKRNFTDNKRVYRGRSDKDWAELLKFREELKKAEQEIEELKTNIHPDLSLRIVYDVHHETHSGYCSDPGDSEVICRTHTEVVGLPVAFKKHDICRNRMLQSAIPSDNQLLLRLFSKPSESCNKGSGHCGCKTIYSIQNTSIFAPIDKSELSKPIELSDII